MRKCRRSPRKINLAETAFVIEPTVLRLRWMTPTVEKVDLCGHATLSVGSRDFSSSRPPVIEFAFNREWRVNGGGKPRIGWCWISLHNHPAAAKNGRKSWCKDCAHNRGRSGKGPITLPFSIARQYQGLGARFRHAGSAPCPRHDRDGTRRRLRFRFRFFAPQSGIPEDPVTGSTHCMLIPYWSKRLGKKALHAHQLSKRGGELFCEDRGERVSIGENAVTYVEGKLHTS